MSTQEIKNQKKFDFSGYATKVDLKCSDGRVIRKDAFKHQDGRVVPLVWQHLSKQPSNVLGHALLQNRSDGVYVYCSFNETDPGKNAKMLVEHGDITSLSIHANDLQQKGSDVLHGRILEVSLVYAGANPGAFIDDISIKHGDGTYEDVPGEAIIFSGEELSLSDITHAVSNASSEKTVQDVFDTLSEEQKTVVYAMLGAALEEGSMSQSATDGEGEKKEEPEEAKEEGKVEDKEELNHSTEGGTEMKTNVFDNKEEVKKNTLTHGQVQTILTTAQKCGSLKEAVLTHAVEYGIENIDFLFPDHKTVTPTPEMIAREMAWVSMVLAGVSPKPFSRIKSMAADITAEEARAKGYVKGNLKKEEIISLLRRTTGPTTIYKKQKLDRDDIIDITDLDVVAWLKAEMRVMLDEERARAIMIGDGRDAESEDKINEECIRPIYTDDEMYAPKVLLESTATPSDIVDEIVRARKDYKGSGNPAFYASVDLITELMLIKDGFGRRLYNTEAELASALRVSKIVEIPLMDETTRVTDDEPAVTYKLLGIMVNLKDYAMGADKGGQVSMFDDFDIDYNQYKYLIEARCSGALTKPASALVFEQEVAQA
jgi:hypothetical protein